MVFIEKSITIVADAHQSIKNLNFELVKKYKFSKKVIINIGKVKDGKLVWCFKGTTDECNNSLFLTYANHHQLFENKIKKIVKRDVRLKINRVARFILTFFSRDEILRKEIKLALQSNDFKSRINI